MSRLFFNSYIVSVCLFLVILTNSVASNEKKNNLLGQQLDSIRVAHNIPGMSYFVVDKDKIIVSDSYGVMDRQSNNKFTLDTVIRIGSITKSFNALALLKLEQYNKLNLDDTIGQYIDDLPLKNQWQDQHPVKIVHLLEHTSGLLDIGQKEFAFNDGAITSIKKAFDFAPENRVLEWRPGFYSSYSNVGAGYLAYIIEKVTQQSYESYLEEFVFKPLNIRGASFFLDPIIKKSLATGYDSDGEKIIPYWNMIFRAFGAINLSSRQMVPFVQLFLNDGRVNKKQFIAANKIKRMEYPTTTLAASVGLTFGYGLANYAFIHEGMVFHGHGGDGDGYLNYYAYNRETGLGYFIVINAFNQKGLFRIREKLQDYIVAEAESLTKPDFIKHDHLSDFVGSYKAVTKRMPWSERDKTEVIITLENNGLYYQYAAIKKRLYPVSQSIFAFANEPVATQAFIKYQKNMYFQNSDGSYIRYP